MAKVLLHLDKIDFNLGNPTANVSHTIITGMVQQPDIVLFVRCAGNWYWPIPHVHSDILNLHTNFKIC